MKIYEHKNIKYEEATITPLVDFDENFREKLTSLNDKFQDEGACVYNAKITAEAIGGECVEGFVICMGAGFPGAIRHCWNKIGEQNIDVTKEFIWSTTRPNATFYYFPLDTFSPNAYSKNYSFNSNAVLIAAGVSNSVNTEAKAMESYNYINFL